MLLLSSFFGSLFASDTTGRKKLVFVSLSAGYTSNTVYGSMHDKDQRINNLGNLGKIEMADRGGFVINVHRQKYLSNFLYWKTGISFVYKQVKPQENTSVYYQDALKTGYLSMPFLFGINGFPIEENPFNLFFELGPSANFRIIDKSYSGPDRVDFKTCFVALSLCTGAGVTYAIDPKVKLLLRYSYMLDLTNSYIETLGWSSAEPKKEFNYKYKTHTLSFGFQWSPK